MGSDSRGLENTLSRHWFSLFEIPLPILTFISVSDTCVEMPEVQTSSWNDLVIETLGGMTKICSGVDTLVESPRIVVVSTIYRSFHRATGNAYLLES